MITVRTMAAATMLAALTTLAAAPAAALELLGGHERDGVVVGLDVGPAWNSYTVAAGSESFVSDPVETFGGSLHVGWAPQDEFLYGLAFHASQKEFDSGDLTIEGTTFGFVVEGAWFPAGRGLWLRGGAGFGTLDFRAPFPDPGLRADFREGGFLYTFGVGFEVRTGEQVAVGVAYDYLKLDVGAFLGFSDVRTTSKVLALSLNYYL